MPVYDEKYIKVKVKELYSVVNTNFWSKKVLGEGMHYTCTACIRIDSIMKMEKKNYAKIFLCDKSIFIVMRWDGCLQKCIQDIPVM